jgi:uncharacterized small protein (TIGR04563 family)
MTDNQKNQKQSLYFPQGMHLEIKEEAERLDRSMSWVVARAWALSRTKIKEIPTSQEVSE